jgi:hypothetical protein
MPQGRRSTPVLPELFAARQVYVRSGQTSRYVALSRALQIWVAIGLGMIVLWLGVASYAAIAKHLQTVAQARELARLESITKTLRATVEEAPKSPESNRQAEAVPDLLAELADAKAARDRAHVMAQAAAGEAGELRHELTLAQDQIRDLKCDLAQAEAERRAVTALGTGKSAGTAEGAEVTLARQVVFADPACAER